MIRPGPLQFPMEEGFDLKEFLEHSRSQGSLQSEGSFTVAAQGAVKKISSFLLQDEFDWVLKVVQAVNLWGCKVLRVRQTRVATSFQFRPEKSVLEYRDIVSALQASEMSKTEPLKVLAVALGSLVQQAKLSFVLAVRSGGTCQSPIYAGDDTSALSEATRQEWTNLSEDGIKLTISHFRGEESVLGRYFPTASRVQRRDIRIFQKLSSRCFASEVPILVDNRDITNIYRDFHLGSNLLWRPLGVGDLSEESAWQPVDYQASTSKLKRPRRFENAWLYLRTADWLFSDFLEEGLPQDLHLHHHQVFFVLAGVVVGRGVIHRNSLATTSYIFLPIGPQNTDLTALSLSMNEELKAEMEKALEGARRLVRSLESHAGRERDSDSSDLAAIRPPSTELDRRGEGFSLLTESLTDKLPTIRTINSAASRFLLSLRRGVGAKALKKDWFRYLRSDLQIVLSDMTGRVQSTSEVLESEGNEWR